MTIEPDVRFVEVFKLIFVSIFAKSIAEYEVQVVIAKELTTLTKFI